MSSKRNDTRRPAMGTPIQPSPASVDSSSSVTSDFSNLSIFDKDSTSVGTPATPPMFTPDYFTCSKKPDDNGIYRLPSKNTSTEWRETDSLYGRSPPASPTRMPQRRASSTLVVYPNIDETADNFLEDITGKLGALTLSDNLALSKELANSPSYRKSTRNRRRADQAKSMPSYPIIGIEEDGHKCEDVPASHRESALETTTDDNIDGKGRDGTMGPNGIECVQKVFAAPDLECGSKSRPSLHSSDFHLRRLSITSTTNVDAMGRIAEPGAHEDHVQSTQLLPSKCSSPKEIASGETVSENPVSENPVSEDPVSEDPVSEEQVPGVTSSDEPDPAGPIFEPFHQQEKHSNDIKLKILEILLHRRDPKKKAKKRKKRNEPTGSSSAVEEGYIYAFTSPSYSKYIKIGKTKQDPDERCKQWTRQCNFTATHIDDANGKKFADYSMVEELVQREFFNERRKFKCLKCKRRHKFDQRKAGHDKSEATEHGEWYEVAPAHALAVVERWRSWAIKQPYTDDGALKQPWRWKYEQAMKSSKIDWDKWVQMRWDDHLSFSFYCFEIEMRIFWPKLMALLLHPGLIIGPLLLSAGAFLSGNFGIALSPMPLILFLVFRHRYS